MGKSDRKSLQAETFSSCNLAAKAWTGNRKKVAITLLPVMGSDWVSVLAGDPPLPLGECKGASSWIGARSDTNLSMELVLGRVPTGIFTGDSVTGAASLRLIVRYLKRKQMQIQPMKCRIIQQWKGERRRKLWHQTFSLSLRTRLRCYVN